MEREGSESPDAYLERRSRSTRRKRRMFLLVAAGLSLVSLFVYGPDWFIQRASDSYTACSNRDYEERPEPSASCDSTAWLSFPKLVPWKRKAALEEETSIQRSVASRAFRQATSFRPNRALRTTAADELARVYRKETDTAASPASEGLLSIFVLEGDADAVHRYRQVATTPSGINNVLRALLAIGDMDAAIELARNPPPSSKEDYGSRDMFLARGVLLCLAGDLDAGGRALAEAERVNEQFHTFPYYEARAARAACGQQLDAEKELDRETLLAFQIGKRLKGDALEARLTGEWVADFSVDARSASPFVAAALVERERDLDETIALVSCMERTPLLGMAPVPWTSRMVTSASSPTLPMPLDPERHERAAAKLEALAKDAPESDDDEKRIDARAKRLPIHTDKRYRAYRSKPRQVLTHFARGLWLEAAAAWSGLGDAARTERAIERTRTLGNRAETAVFAAPILIGIGRWESAKKILQGASTDADDATRSLLYAFEAQLLAHDRKWKAALEKAEAALALAEKLPTGIGPPIALGVRWLVLALAFETNDLAAAPVLKTPEIHEREAQSWTEVVAMPEPDRAILRWRMRGVDIGGLPVALPAQIFVVGQAARGLDVEVWLDHELGLFDRRLTGAPALRARAEAARWRADEKAEADWLARADRLEKRFSDPKKRVLGSLLGL